jgi:hypothetical protein
MRVLEARAGTLQVKEREGLMRPKLEWKPAKVGCYWFAERGQKFFAISTVVQYQNGQAILTFPSSYYALYANTHELGRFKTLKEAQRAAEIARVPA